MRHGNGSPLWDTPESPVALELMGSRFWGGVGGLLLSPGTFLGGRAGPSQPLAPLRAGALS